ncbi:IS1 family transposase, partial [Citrobacter freundii]|uniref:IS1 family transposase n=1 Tax=Citrobacter freundii TaxID=546 RepID=UPI0039B457E8
EWVHVQLHQQKGMISLSPPTICNSAHNLNLRQHLARLGRKSLSFSKSVELHDKVIGHYLTINHYP